MTRTAALPGGRWLARLPSVTELLNRDLPPHRRIELRVAWALWLLPIALVNQIFAPHPVWMVLLIAVAGFYGLGYFWVRSQAPAVSVSRERLGSILVAGDQLQEEFTLHNESRLPILWAEFVDESTLPGYQPGRVVGCPAASFYRWRSQVTCRQRGVFRLGPHRLHLGDPLGLFSLRMDFDYTDVVVIYPRVVRLPQIQLPKGNTNGVERRRWSLRGPLPAASVTEYRPGDSLRHIHWRTTAHQGRLMVKELETEPSGDVWIVLDVNRAVHQGEGPTSTLEFAVMAAASLAAELLSGGTSAGGGGPGTRAVGLLTAAPAQVPGVPGTWGVDGVGAAHDGARTVLLPPQPGQAQLWRILAALAPLQAVDVTLADLLYSSHAQGGAVLGRRAQRAPALVVITPQWHLSDAPVLPRKLGGQVPLSTPDIGSTEDGDQAQEVPARRDNWVAELLHLQAQGLASSVLLVAHGTADKPADGAQTDGAQTAEEMAEQPEQMRALLARHEIPTQVLWSGRPLEALLTYRRRRTVIRTTPTGGVVTYEVEEEVG